MFPQIISQIIPVTNSNSAGLQFAQRVSYLSNTQLFLITLKNCNISLPTNSVNLKNQISCIDFPYTYTITTVSPPLQKISAGQFLSCCAAEHVAAISV